MSVFAGALLSVLAAGQTPPPLTHLLRTARVHNHAVGISKAQLAEQEAALDQAFAVFWPTLRATGSYTRNQYAASFSLPASFFGGAPTETRTLTIQPYNALNASVGLNVPLVNVGNFYRHAEAKHAREAARLSALATEAEVLLSTARAYYRVVGAQGVVTAAQTALGTAEDNRKVTGVKLSAGTQTRLALDRAEVDVARAQQTLALGVQMLALAIRNLETLTGEKVTGPFPPPDSPDGVLLDESGYVAEAGSLRPEIQREREALRQQELSVGESWSQLAPSLSGNVNETFTNITGFTGKSAYWTAGASLSWNVDPLTTRAAVRRASAAVDEQRHRLAQAEDSVQDDVHSSWLEVRADLARAEQSDREFKSAHDALLITQKQYEAGTATSLDVSAAQRDAFTAEATLAQSRADLAAAFWALRKAAGESLLPANDGEAP